MDSPPSHSARRCRWGRGFVTSVCNCHRRRVPRRKWRWAVLVWCGIVASHARVLLTKGCPPSDPARSRLGQCRGPPVAQSFHVWTAPRAHALWSWRGVLVCSSGHSCSADMAVELTNIHSLDSFHVLRLSCVGFCEQGAQHSAGSYVHCLRSVPFRPRPFGKSKCSSTKRHTCRCEGLTCGGDDLCD